MSRLTNKMREAVITAMHDTVIKPRYGKLQGRLAKACQKAADKAHPPEVRKWLEAIPQKAKPLLEVVSSVTPMINGSKWEDPFQGEGNNHSRSVRISLTSPIYKPESMGWGSKLEIGNTRLQVDMDQLWADWCHLRSTMREALYACTTVKRLSEHYPELAKHLPKPEPVTKALMITGEKVKDAIKCAAKGGCK